MLGRREREGLITMRKRELENGVTETLTAFKHVDSCGRMHLTQRLLTTRDRDGVVLAAVDLEDIVTLLVG